MFFLFNVNHPIRFEFFGDTIESIREFDEDNQKSISNISTITIRPYSEFILDDDIDVLEENKSIYLNTLRLLLF